MKRASDWQESIGERRVEQSREGMCNQFLSPVQRVG